jgi:hypothetical protein
MKSMFGLLFLVSVLPSAMAAPKAEPDWFRQTPLINKHGCSLAGPCRIVEPFGCTHYCEKYGGPRIKRVERTSRDCKSKWVGGRRCCCHK